MRRCRLVEQLVGITAVDIATPLNRLGGLELKENDLTRSVQRMSVDRPVFPVTLSRSLPQTGLRRLDGFRPVCGRIRRKSKLALSSL